MSQDAQHKAVRALRTQLNSGHEPNLSPRDLADLALAAYRQDQNPTTLERLAAALIPLANFHAYRYRGRGVAKDELEGVAGIALGCVLSRLNLSYSNDEIRGYVRSTVVNEVKRHFPRPAPLGKGATTSQ